MTVLISSRSLFGFRLMSILPLFGAALVPSTPMKDERDSTAGSCRIRSATCSCPAGHRVEGYRLGRFGNALYDAGILKREEAFRDDDVKEGGDDDGADGDD